MIVSDDTGPVFEIQKPHVDNHWIYGTFIVLNSAAMAALLNRLSCEGDQELHSQSAKFLLITEPESEEIELRIDG